jgi:hypothetical protein
MHSSSIALKRATGLNRGEAVKGISLYYLRMGETNPQAATHDYSAQCTMPGNMLGTWFGNFSLSFIIQVESIPQLQQGLGKQECTQCFYRRFEERSN